MGKLINLAGQRFGKLTVIKRVEDKILPSGRHTTMWLCQCDCGNYTTVSSGHLRANKIKSCGCLIKEIASEINKTHGKAKSRLYNVWSSMKARCCNPNNNRYKNYGGRGIKVCDEWKNDFMNFHNWAMQNGYDETALRGKCTIDRINVNGNYCPENCRWVTMGVQLKNTTQNRMLTYKGMTKPFKEWSDELGINYHSLYTRLEKGWSIDKAFKTPIRPLIKENR